MPDQNSNLTWQKKKKIYPLQTFNFDFDFFKTFPSGHSGKNKHTKTEETEEKALPANNDNYTNFSQVTDTFAASNNQDCSIEDQAHQSWTS